MALALQNLRAIGPGIEPASLLPGQIAFNITDKVMFVGDGSSYKTPFEGTPVPGVAGEGWYSMPMDFGALSSFFVANPEVYGNTPANQQVLAWDSGLGHPVWVNPGGDGAGQIYMTSNSAVASAPGASLTSKLNSALGFTPSDNDTVIVTGNPGDLYEGYYGYVNNVWQFASHFAFPSAAQVPYDNAVSGLTAANVQDAITEIAEIAQAALPLSGGTMLGNINFFNGQPVDAGLF